MRSPLHRLFVPTAFAVIWACTTLTTFAQVSAAGRSFRFDGLNDYAFVTNFGSIMPTGAVTIEWWMSAEIYTNQFVFALNPEQTTNRLAFTGPGPAPTGRLTWEHGDTNAGGLLAFTPTNNLSNTWTHFAVVSDPAAGGSMTLYRNGAFETSKTGMSPLAAGNLLLELGGSSVRTQFFKGQLDEVRVWDTARTRAELQFHRHRPITNIEPGLVAYYRFDEFSGALVADSSTNGNNAVLTNASTGSVRPTSGALMERLTAITFPVTNALLTGATLGGAGTTFYWTCGAWFTWGPVGFPTNILIPPFPPLSPTNILQSRLGVLTGLQPGLTYEARFHISNGVDIASGPTVFFKTRSLTNSSVALPAISSGVMAWGDADNDGDLDLLVCGESATGTVASVLYTQAGLFVSQLPLLETTNAVVECAGAWGDYDNDGDLDIALTGLASGPTNRFFILRNDLTNFTALQPAGLSGVTAGSVAWGDYDNDGNLDLLVTGTLTGAAAGASTRVYRNDGMGVFSDRKFPNLRGVYRGAAAWGDHDRGDGWLDILVAGEASGAPLTNALLYRNLVDGAGFTNIAIFQGVRRATVAWADYDIDGKLDFILTGATNIIGGDRPFSSLYRHSTLDTYTPLLFGLTNIHSGASAWGDYDNDGEIDLAITGQGDTQPVSILARNMGGGTLANSSEPILAVTNSTMAWGDFDNDGDLDLVSSGWPTGIGGRISRLHLNLTTHSNTLPAAPDTSAVGFRGSNGTSVSLSWKAATDAETALPTYNVRMGTNSGGHEIIPPHSDPVTGWRRLPAMGNMFHRTSGIVTNLNPFLTYYWAVQAVDAAFAGGPWSAEAAFHYVDPVTLEASNLTHAGVTLPALVHPYGLDTWAWFEWGESLTNHTPMQALGGPLTATNVAAAIPLTNIPPLTTVFYRIAASNSVGTVRRGAQLSFVTPWLAFSMPGISNGLAPGQFNACLLSLTNLTASPANLTFTFEGGTPSWLGVTGPATVPAGASTTLGLVFNALTLAPGTYATTLVVSAAGLPDVRVPVSLSVGPPYTAKPGDLNKDGVVDLMELNTVIQYYRGLLP